VRVEAAVGENVVRRNGASHVREGHDGHDGRETRPPLSNARHLAAKISRTPCATATRGCTLET
jgi:hypothetical protein